jgi:aldose 1-epimerase
MSLTHDGLGAWPFRFTAEQYFELGPDSLRVEIRMTNRHEGPAPAGLGLHPYFHRPEGATLRFKAESVWMNDATALPVSQVAVPDAWNHAAGLAVGSVALDNCYNGWDGVAHIGLRSTQITIEASAAFSHLQVYTPAGQDFFCVEPVTHRPNAINAARGMTILAPGQTLAGSVHFLMTEPSSA